MSKKTIVIIVVIVALIGVGFFMMKPPADMNKMVTKQATAALKKGDLSVTVTGTGSIAAGDRQTIKPEQAGVVDTVKVAEGDTVKKGQTIAVMAGEDNADQIRSQKVNLQKKQLDLEATKASYDQAKTDEEKDKLTIQMKQAKLDIQLTQATIADLKEKAQSSTIVAPIAGKVATLNMKAGDEINTMTDVAEVVNYANMSIVVAVDELDIAQVKLQQTANIAVEAVPNEDFTGVVTEIADEGTSNNGVATFDVTISIDATKSKALKAGMSAVATIQIANKKDALLLPIDAVQSLNKKYTVTKSDQTEQEVKVGLHNEDFIEITSGLSEGDQVILPTVATTTNQQQGFGLGGGGFGSPPAGQGMGPTGNAAGGRGGAN